MQGLERVVIVKVEKNGHLKARVRPLPLPDDSSRELEALALSVVETASKYVNLMQGQPAQEIAQAFAAQGDPLQLAFLVASVMNLDVEKEQSLLETSTRIEALRMVLGWLSHEVEVAELRAKVTEKARSEMSKEQRDYVLRQQKKAIEQELGEGKTDEAEAEDLREKLAKADLPGGRPQGSRPRAGAAGEDQFGLARAQRDPHVARVRDRAAVEEAQRRQPGSEAGPRGSRRGPLRNRQGQRAHPRAPGRAQAESGGQGSDSVLRGRAGRGQDVAGAIHRPRAGTQVRAHEPGRLAR